ncbi:acid ceramidase-like [Ischnura elegans]|uniref:acid ceramidase-like n=1 Tax=Ischnura elegans TaxID=197161 RepID=UPI001ED86D37|nr:acid ceramidase-like [Ischnura elegans]
MRSCKHLVDVKVVLCFAFIFAQSSCSRKESSIEIFTPPASEFPPFNGCVTTAQRAPLRGEISMYKIDLDVPPRKRWTALLNDYRKEVLDLIGTIKDEFVGIFGESFYHLCDKYFPDLAKTLPEDYYEELLGIAEELDLHLSDVTLYNVFYELFSVCTSIVIESPSGEIYHGRNLDFGLFMGWNIQNKTWIAPELLRKLTVILEFHKKGHVIYKAVNFVGYTGILTGVKQDAFSLTINERFRLNGGFVGITEWIIGLRKEKWLGLLTREVMEYADTYTTAQHLLSTPKLVAPVYFILAGTKPGEGSVITRGRDSSDIWPLGGENQRNASWYLVQTNSDHWKKPPFFDNRRDPAEYCLEKIGHKHPEKTLQSVLSTRPVLNKLTVYSAIMQAASGNLNVWLQDCADPCWPW